RARLSGEPLEPRESPVSDAGRGHADERRALHAPVAGTARTVDPHGPRRVGADRNELVLFQRDDRVEWRRGGGAVPRAPEARRRRDETPDRRVPDGVLRSAPESTGAECRTSIT